MVFSPSGRRGMFPLGTPLLQAARVLGVDVDSVCGGRGLCGRCRIVCTAGEFPKLGITCRQEHLSPFSATERSYGERRGALSPGHRLSCQATVQGDLHIDVPPESQAHRPLVRKQADRRNIRLDPVLHLYYVAVPAADLHEARSDMTRLLDALEQQWGFKGISWRNPVLGNLQASLRQGDWSVTVALYNDKEIIAVWPGYKDKIYGLAIDVGSTTIAAHLCDLDSGAVLASEGMMNPQIRFGEDLMSRVSYLMMQPQGVAEMTQAVRAGINQLVTQLGETAGVATQDMLSISLVGNPIMHHLTLGISPIELGAAPFALAVDSAVHTEARALHIDINPGGVVYALPCIAGHVGGDTAGVILSEQPHKHDAISLIIDVGTNAEIVLGNRERLLACSSPTGPAFEGAQLSCGQRAAPGAIERVRIDPQTLQAKVKVIGSDYWSDEPGFAAAGETIGVTGICGSGIIEAVAEMYLCGILSSDGVINGALAEHTDTIMREERTFAYVLYRGASTVVITQTDIRQIQLAKAALYAGVKLLLDRIAPRQVERICLAGAFGSHISARHAMVLGMIPDCPLEQVASVGNAAGTGARIALLNKAARKELERLVRKIEKIETATEPRFQEYFVNAMAIPHKTDPFPALATAVTLPTPSSPEAARAMRRDTQRRRQRRATQQTR